MCVGGLVRTAHSIFGALTACLPYARDPPKSEAAVVFQHVCEMGLEGIVSAAWLARRSGRSTDWLTFKNPKALVVKPEGEEEWGTEKWR